MYKGHYKLIGSELSFFTRKLEAQLRSQQIPWHYLFKNEERKAELEAKAGTHFIPLLMTPDKWLIHDTIAIGPSASGTARLYLKRRCNAHVRRMMPLSKPCSPGAAYWSTTWPEIWERSPIRNGGLSPVLPGLTRQKEITMSTRVKIWLLPALLYAVFFYWYTDFGGPLSDAEVDQFVATMKTNGSDTEVIAFTETFARQDSGRQFLMVNNIDMNEDPPDVEGAGPGESGSDLMARYMEHMIPALLARACHPVLMGSAIYPAMDLVGIEGAENWDQAALFRYRSRRAFLEIVTNPVFRGKHHFKTAALEKTIAYPIETDLYPGDPRLLLGLILLAITALIDSFRLSKQKGTDHNS